MYTRTGDLGQTGLRGGQRLSKASVRVQAYGAVDELNASLGVARELASQAAVHTPSLDHLVEALLDAQHRLFNLGSSLATLPADLPPEQRVIGADDVTQLEREMDRCSAELPPLTSFILPGGCVLNAQLHVSRTVCRRAERRCVELGEATGVDPQSLQYLNRLGDTLFVWARWAAVQLRAPETPWMPDR